MLTLLVALACSSSKVGGGVAEDSGLVIPEEDCSAGTSGNVSDVTVEATGIPTVLRVKWVVSRDASTWVEFADADAPLLRTPAVAGAGSHEALLLGAPADADVAFRVAEDDGDRVFCGDSNLGHTDRFAGDPPDLAETGPGGDLLATGFLAMSVFDLDASYISLLDRAGHYVWSWPLPSTAGASRTDDVLSPVVRVHASRDGTSLLFNRPSDSELNDATLYRVALDGLSVTQTEVMGGHVDFTETPDGTLLMLGWETRAFGDRTLVGDTITAIYTDGTQERVWDAFDVFDVNLDVTYEKGYYGPDPNAEFWTHVNSIRYDDDRDALVLTMTLGNSAFVLDAHTFALQWMLSADGGDFAVVDSDYPGPLLNHPHSAALVGDNVLVFSRGDPADTSICAEASEIALDQGAGTAQKIWRWMPDECMIVPFLGNAERLANDDTLVNFASLGQIDEVNPDGDLVMQLNTAVGAAFGFVDFLPTLYR